MWLRCRLPLDNRGDGDRVQKLFQIFAIEDAEAIPARILQRDLKMAPMNEVAVIVATGDLASEAKCWAATIPYVNERSGRTKEINLAKLTAVET